MKEIKNINENKILNLLLPQAINQNNQIHKEIKQRIKLNKIFKEFDNKASNEFNYFIKESNNRYNNLKNGYSLKNLLLESKQKNIDEANKILQDPFYMNLNLEKEKQKMKKMGTKELSKDIIDTLSKIKKTKNMNNKDSSIEDEEISNRKNDNKYNNYFYSIMKNKHKHNFNNYNTGKRKVTFITEKKRKNIINYDKDMLSNLFINEKNLLNNSFDNYKNIIPKDIDKHKLSIKEREKIKIKLPKLKLLNYKSVKNIHKKNEDKEENYNTIDYKYLLSFSDKNKYKRKNIYMTPIKNNPEKYDISFPLITEVNNNQIYNSKNYGNTLDVVVNSAKKEINKENDMNNKIYELENKLGLDDTPKVHLYDEILKKKSETIKAERREKARKIIEKQKYLGGSIKEKINRKIDEKVKLLDRVMRNFNNYNEKEQ